MRRLKLVVFLVLGPVLGWSQHAQERPSAVAMRCDGMNSPLALEDARPVLSWTYPMGRFAAARVLVARTEHAFESERGQVWESGWTPAPVFSQRYDGPALLRNTRYYWKVEVRDREGKVSSITSPASFRTAEGPWSAQWIQASWSTERDGAELDGSRPMPVFRREFSLRQRPVEAVLRIAGLGQYEAQLNQDPPLAPGAFRQAWTDYRKTVTYDSYRIVSGLKPGRNVLAVLLGNGMYNVQKTQGRYTKFAGSYGVPKLIAELNVRYPDRSTERIATDTQWQAARGPILFSSIYGGEDFDARHWPSGWDSPGHTGSEWQAATVATPPGGVLTAAIAPPVLRHESRGAVGVHVVSSTRTVYDMGQNLAGWPTITVQGPAGTRVRLTAGELLNEDGTVSQVSTGGPQWWTYTLGGRGKEHWTPRFSYWGYRYIQADWSGPETAGGPAAPSPKPSSSGRMLHIVSDALSSASPVTGSFASSSEELNSIHRIIVWAMRNNEVSLLTDCPHRERLGWLEETHLVAPGLLFNNDLQGLYAATAHNIADAQMPDGMVPTIAPQYTKFGPKYAIFDDSPEWGSAAILAPWAAYRFYGDTGLLERNYSTMQRYLHYLEGRAQAGIVAYGLGDWYDIGPGGPGLGKNTTLGVTGTLMLYEDAVAMEKIAALLGHDQDAAEDQKLAEQESTAFNQRFWSDAKGFYDTGSQTANSMPLALGIVPREHREAVLQHVIADIHAHGDHITTGEVGYPYLVRALSASGHSDLLFAMMLKTDPPSYGSQLEKGATSLTEAWDANPRNSQDHFMLGGAEEWFYRGLGGIDIDISRPSPSERITIRPQIVPGLRWVRTSYNSELGTVGSAWEQTSSAVTMTVTIPGGTDATVYVPAREDAAVTEGGSAAEHAKGVSLLRREAGAAIFRVGPGTYQFRATAAAP